MSCLPTNVCFCDSVPLPCVSKDASSGTAGRLCVRYVFGVTALTGDDVWQEQLSVNHAHSSLSWVRKHFDDATRQLRQLPNKCQCVWKHDIKDVSAPVFHADVSFSIQGCSLWYIQTQSWLDYFIIWNAKTGLFKWQAWRISGLLDEDVNTGLSTQRSGEVWFDRTHLPLP